MAQNMQTIKSNKQIMQAFIQIMERLIPSLQVSFSLLYLYLSPQSTANSYDSTKQ
jgi:hypothetical protein